MGALTEEQLKIVKSKAFKNWFAGSKVVDENGLPLTVWHGGSAKFTVFKNTYWNYFYFAKEKGYAKHFSKGNLKPYFLNIKNILDATEFGLEKHKAQAFMDFLGMETSRLRANRGFGESGWGGKDEKFWELLRYDDDLFDYFVKQGYDGITFWEDFKDYDDKTIVFVCFYPNQMKLADGSNTLFDGDNTDIRFKNGGAVDGGVVKKSPSGVSYTKKGITVTIIPMDISDVDSLDGRRAGRMYLTIDGVTKEHGYWMDLDYFVRKNNPVAVVGHSLGGYLAYYISQKFNIPALMISPDLGKEWDTKQPIDAAVKTIRPNPENKIAVLGTLDDDINLIEVEKFLRGKSRIYRERMEHQIPNHLFSKYFTLLLQKLTPVEDKRLLIHRIIYGVK